MDSADLLKQKRVEKSPLNGGDKPRPVHAVLAADWLTVTKAGKKECHFARRFD